MALQAVLERAVVYVRNGGLRQQDTGTNGTTGTQSVLVGSLGFWEPLFRVDVPCRVLCDHVVQVDGVPRR